MKTYRSKTGPFSEQPFYEPSEVESICSDELKKVDLYPSGPAPIRIDRFIEKRFGVQPSYEDLPKGILGFTRFSTKGVAEVVIAKALDSEGTVPAERRLRTTLAHEGGHGLLHAHLFAFNAVPRSLFGDGLAPDSPKILCRDDGGPSVGEKRPPYRWWEFQANLAMSSLLLPRTLVEAALESTIVHTGLLGTPSIPDRGREEAIRLISDTFNVNPIVARIRLDTIYPASAQLHL